MPSEILTIYKQQLNMMLFYLINKCKWHMYVCNLMLLLTFVMPSMAKAQVQEQSYTGVVRNALAETISGATVRILGTNKATSTDGQGRFEISAQPRNQLIITYVGYEDRTITLTANARNLNIQLEASDASLIEDVVVVGYGTQRITKVSGAISTVKGEDIEKLRPTRVEEALQGRASGVNVIQGGTPGSKPTVLVRGIPSFSGTDPMVIVDGVPQSLDDLNAISSTDIESINVLKDAATTAIYGIKGGNGVIVVTTKSGRKNAPVQIGINTNVGYQEAVKKINMLNATEYAGIINEGSIAAGGNAIFPDITVFGEGVDWQEMVFEKPLDQSYNLTANGGGEKTTYFLSAGWLGQGGIVGGYDKSRFNRATGTANMSYDLSNKLKFTLNTSYVLINSKGIQENSFNSILGSALNYDPTVPLYNTDPNIVGQYGFSTLLLSEIFNPLTKLDNTYNTYRGNKIYGKGELTYSLLHNLRFTSRFGYSRYDDNGKTFNPLVFYGVNNVDNSMNADGSTVTGKHNSVSHNKNEYFNYTWENFVNYDFKVNELHNFETVLGMSAFKATGNGMSATRQDVPYNSWEFADFSAATGANSSERTDGRDGSYGQYFRKNLSYFGRVNYDFNERYLASVSMRRDGSYAFGSNNKFANFLSGSLGWVVSNEDFFQSEFINLFKIRASYGTIGNENVSPQFAGISTGGPVYGPNANSNGYNFSGVFYSGSSLTSIDNPSLAWEKQVQANVGFNLQFANNKFSLDADYFHKTVDGLLFTPSASLYLGTVAIPTANIGSTQTDGLDITFGYNDNYGSNWKFGSALTITTAKNKVTATNDDGTAKIIGGGYFNGQSQTVTVFEKGETPGYFYGYKTAGLFQNQDEIDAWAQQDGARPGDIKFMDINEDGVINASDMTKIGDPFPSMTLGLSLNLSYKMIDFSAFLYSSFGNDLYRAYERNANYSNKPNSILNRWTGPNSTNDARYPRYSFTDANNNNRVSDRFVEDGSFLKVKNLQLGYTLENPQLSKYVKSIRLFAQVKNAFTFTNYLGYDPELPGGIMNTGVDRGAYPQARTFSFGANFKF